MNGEDYEAAKDEHRPDWPGYHLPECPYSQPCPDEWRNSRTIKEEGLPVPHRIVSGSSGRCVECDAGDCLCYERREAFAAGVQAARDAVAAALGEHSPGGSVALAAIDALRGES